MDAIPTNTSQREQCISLIVHANGDSTDEQICQSVRSAAVAKWRAQVLIVDPDAIDRNTCSARITYRPIPRVFKTLSGALCAAKHETIVIVDPGTSTQPADWQWISTRTNPEKIQCFLNKPICLSGFKRILLAFYQLLVRMLLKTGKSEYTSGVVLFPRHLVPWQLVSEAAVVNQAAVVDESVAPQFGTTRLLAFANLVRFPVEEFSIGNAVSNGSPSPIHSRRLWRSTTDVVRFWWNQIMFPGTSAQDECVRTHVKPAWKLAAFGVLLVATITLMFSNLDYPLVEPDEARNAQLAINVIESGDWMSLKLARKSYWDKPPAQIWAIATSYQLFGIHPAATRYPGALATTLTILFTLMIGRRLVGFRAAFLGAVLLLLSCGFVFIGRYVTMDASLTCCLTIMTLSLFVATQSQFKRKWMVLAGLAAGVGLLVKGPVVMVLGLPPLLGTLWLTRNPNLYRISPWLFFLVPAVSIASPWFIATTINHPDFFVYFFWKHHVVRFSDAFNHREPFWYYIPAILIMMFPASYLIPSLFRFVSSRNIANRNLRTTTHGFLILMAVWVVGFFSLSESKLPTYILPAFPSLCLMMGVLLDKKIFSSVQSGWHASRQSTPRKRIFLEGVPQRGTVELLLLTVVIVSVLKFVFEVSVPWWAAGIGLLLTALMVVIARKSQSRPEIAWACIGILAFCFVSLGINQLAPKIAESRSIHLAAKNLRSTAGMQDAPIVFFGRENYGASMTLKDEKVVFFRVAEADAVCRYLQSHPHAVLVSSKPQMKNLRRMLNWRILLESAPTRHLYLSRPNPTMARNRKDQLFR